MKHLLNILRKWLPLAVVIIGTCGLGYLLAQQASRQGLNDPQIQMAQDAAAALSAGATPQALLPQYTTDIGASLAPFMIIYDDSGNVIASTGSLHAQIPDLPPGVLEYTRINGEDRVTWQPEAGVRIAAVVVRSEGSQPGFVLAGRNMREVEARIEQFGQLTLLALLATLVFSLAAVVFGELFLHNRKTS
jgi:hypothetical protein